MLLGVHRDVIADPSAGTTSLSPTGVLRAALQLLERVGLLLLFRLFSLRLGFESLSEDVRQRAVSQVFRPYVINDVRVNAEAEGDGDIQVIVEVGLAIVLGLSPIVG